MHISLASILAIATCIGAVSASKHHHKPKHHKSVKHHHKSSGPAKGKAFDHILQVWFENQDFEVVNDTPGFKELLKKGILLDNFNAITHPSEPNYVSAAGASTYGVNNDDWYNIPANISTIFDLLEKKGLSWKLYQEDIPAVGNVNYRDGEYVRKHNPAASFDSVATNATRMQNIVDGDQFELDIFNEKLPNWMFYTPNMLNDGHDTNASYAGAWLKNFYENTLSNPKLYDNTLILITFDETQTYTIRNKVWSILLGAIPKHLEGTVDSTYYTHFSTISTVEHNWNLGNLGQQDVNKTVSNVFEFVAKAAGYENVYVPESEIGWNNDTIFGMMSGKSWNETHTSGVPVAP